MRYIYSTSQISKLSLTLYTFSITGLVASLFLTNKESELNVQTNIKTTNRKKLQLHALVNLRYTHTGINK